MHRKQSNYHLMKKFFIAFMMLLSVWLIQPLDTEAANIVNPKKTYSYETMVKDIKSLAKKYPDLIEYKIIGYSEYNRPIYAVSLGTGNATIFINGSHHAREWITTNLNMYMLEQYAKKYKANATYGGYNVRKVLDETKIWFVPMVNPDGVTLQQYGLSKFPKSIHKSLIKMNEGSTNFKRWKANAKGVDLNRQYRADWANIKNNFSYPRWSNHKGWKPEQASEAKAIVKFTKEIDPEIATAYHSSGEILYWNFHQSGKIYNRDHKIAKKIGQYTGYSLVYPGPNPSGGGYTDWFIAEYKRPGFTPELGRYAGNTHVPLSGLDRIWNQNRYVGLYMASEGYKLYLARGGVPKYEEAAINIDGKVLKTDQPALIMKGTTVVPVRGVFEHLGAYVGWNQQTKTVTVTKDSTKIELKLGSKTMKVNGNSKQLTLEPQSINNRTMIPVRAVSEAIGAKVVWDSKAKTVFITSPEIVNDDTPPVPPTVNTITDVTLKVTGTTEKNANVVVKYNGKVLGKAKANKDGAFTVKIPAQKANRVLLITATDVAGNTSQGTKVTVSYTSTFTDSIGHWAQEEIGYMKDEGITAGFADGSFGVNKNISRGEAATMLARALGLGGDITSKPNFPDVLENHPFYPSIAAIFDKGIMTGKTGGMFKPDDSLTRAEMATILVNAFELESNGEVAFPDVSSSHWAYDAINILASNELIAGYDDGSFRPNQPITRAEFGSLLVRVLQFEPEEVMQEEQPEHAVQEEQVEQEVQEEQSELPEQAEQAKQVDSNINDGNEILEEAAETPTEDMEEVIEEHTEEN